MACTGTISAQVITRPRVSRVCDEVDESLSEDAGRGTRQRQPRRRQ